MPGLQQQLHSEGMKALWGTSAAHREVSRPDVTTTLTSLSPPNSTALLQYLKLSTHLHN